MESSPTNVSPRKIPSMKCWMILHYCRLSIANMTATNLTYYCSFCILQIVLSASCWSRLTGATWYKNTSALILVRSLPRWREWPRSLGRQMQNVLKIIMKLPVAWISMRWGDSLSVLFVNNDQTESATFCRIALEYQARGTFCYSQLYFNWQWLISYERLQLLSKQMFRISARTNFSLQSCFSGKEQ